VPEGQFCLGKREMGGWGNSCFLCLENGVKASPLESNHLAPSLT
jgi:hypothetical protein